ncbi:MAG: amidohydrolase [Candidatus Tectomicrobia bacterium]|nr:amidohydrolase [Candidatus Tectomicrobia bacterium]
MRIDFHSHFMPLALLREHLKPGQTQAVVYDRDGQPRFTAREKQYNMELRLEDMERAGLDTAVLSSPLGWNASLAMCRLVNEELAELQQRYPRRMVGLAHLPPAGGSEGLRELERSVRNGLRGVSIVSQVVVGERLASLDAPELEEFYSLVEELDVPVFVHPPAAPKGYALLNDYDLARCIGREFDLVVAIVRLILGGVLERHPRLNLVIAHFGGGLTTLAGRIERYQEKSFFGLDEPSKVEQFRDGISRLYFDAGGFFGWMNALLSFLLTMPPERLLFGSDYPQEITSGEGIRGYIQAISGLSLGPTVLHNILGGTAARLLKLESAA